MTRLQQMEADGIDPMLPPLPAPAIVEWLMEIGPVEAAGMGGAAISWRTIRAWQSCTGVILRPWQGKLLRRLSGDWLTESDRASKADCPPPWVCEATEVNREAVAFKIGSAFDAFITRQKAGA